MPCLLPQSQVHIQKVTRIETHLLLGSFRVFR